MLPPPAATASASPPPGMPYPGLPMGGFPMDLYGRPQVPPAMQAKFDPWALLQALQRRWLLAFVLGVVAASAGIAGAYWFLWQPEKKYAAAWAYVYPKQPYLLYEPPEEPEGAALARLRTEAEMARSYAVVMLALQDPELEKLEDFANLTENERLNWLMADRYRVYPSEKDNSISIVVVSGDHEHWLVPLTNALLRSYLKVTNDAEKEARELRYQSRYELYMDNGGREQADLDGLKQKQRELEAANPGAADERKVLQGQKRDVMAKKGALLDQISELKYDRDDYRAELGDTSVTLAEIQAELDADEKLQEMLVEAADLETGLALAPSRFNDGMKNPIAVRMVARQKDLETELAEYRARRTQEVRDELQAQKEAAINQALVKYDYELGKLNKRLDRLNGQIADLDKQLSLLPNTTVPMEDLEALVNSFPLLARFNDELYKMRKESNAPPRVVHKSDAGAALVEQQVSPMRKVAMAGLGALAVVLAGVSLLEYRIRRIHNVHEVVEGLGLRLLGTIPTWSPRITRGHGYGTSLAYNLWTESVDTARTMVTHAAQAESARVVMITSATSGEGKTSLASHLASSLARAGHRTLLVDGDLRSPAIQVLFDLGLTPGLCEVLRGQVSLEQAVQATPARGLFLLTAGQWDSGALQALAQGGAKELFARLKEQFDYVIVDSSPVLAVSDALLIGRHVDGVLISILRDVSRVPTVYAAYQRLGMMGIRTLGAVVNGARTERYGSWYNASPAAA